MKFVDVQKDGVLVYAFPNTQVTGFLPIEIGQGGFSAGTVSVHDVAEPRVVAKAVFYDLAKCLGIKSFVQTGYGLMHIFLGGRHAPLHVSFVHRKSMYGSAGKVNEIKGDWNA